MGHRMMTVSDTHIIMFFIIMFTIFFCNLMCVPITPVYYLPYVLISRTRRGNVSHGSEICRETIDSIATEPIEV